MSVTFYAARESGSRDYISGPNFANDNARMILRSLDLPAEGDCFWTFDLGDLEGRVATALAVGGTIEDDGMPNVSSPDGRWTECGVRPNYFASAYGQIARFIREARAKDLPHLYAA